VGSDDPPRTGSVEGDDCISEYANERAADSLP